MDFTTAWEKKTVEANMDKPSTIQAEIYFGNGKIASMVIPQFFTNEDAMKNDLKRAWETYCKNKPHEINSIITIKITNNGENFFLMEKKDKKSA